MTRKQRRQENKAAWRALNSAQRQAVRRNQRDAKWTIAGQIRTATHRAEQQAVRDDLVAFFVGTDLDLTELRSVSEVLKKVSRH